MLQIFFGNSFSITSPFSRRPESFPAPDRTWSVRCQAAWHQAWKSGWDPHMERLKFGFRGSDLMEIQILAPEKWVWLVDLPRKMMECEVSWVYYSQYKDYKESHKIHVFMFQTTTQLKSAWLKPNSYQLNEKFICSRSEFKSPCGIPFQSRSLWIKL